MTNGKDKTQAAILLALMSLVPRKPWCDVSEEVTIGLLGLGNVGSAVVRATRRAADVLGAHGLHVNVDAALVRDPERVRPEGAHVRFVTASPTAFFARRYDAVVEVLGGVEPAASLVSRLLDSGTPVITANKSLLAARGRTLTALARTRNTHLLFEASVVAGVPFLDAIARRPLAGAIDRVEAILNGTSNFILTLMDVDGVTLDEALTRAQALGYAEPDPQNDVSGRDAAEKLCVLLRHLGIADLAPDRIQTSPLTNVRSEDVKLARRAGSALKPIARATRSPDGTIAASVGPEVLDADHPLARVHGALNGVLLQSRFAGPLFYSGPGAGPDVTAATILDDLATLVDAGALRPNAAVRA